MKVIGIVDSRNYLVQVSHTELEKVSAKYFGEMAVLKVGDTMDISEGYDFREDIKQSCRKMVEACESFDAKRATLLKFANMVLEQK